MKELKAKYDQITSEREEILKQIKKYFKLCSENEELSKLQEKLYKQMKVEEYSSCNHIWVNDFHDYDGWEGRSKDYCGCIKCGLDSKVFYLMDRHNNYKLLTLDQAIMYDFLRDENAHKNGIQTNIFCDLALAKAIYSRIKTAHPDIDDETAIKYFNVAINDIRNKEVSDERKASRAKRLLLSPKFNKWDGIDVIYR